MQSDGTLWAWGYNLNGQLGDGTTTDRNTPSQIDSNLWISIIAGEYHSIALKSARQQFCATGYNAYGQLGDGTTSDKSSFVCSTNSQCNTTFDTLNITTCQSYSFNNQTLTSSGTYTDTLTNASGCDSIVILNLTILPPSTGSLSQTTCDSVYFGGGNRSSTGVYTDTLANYNGCDSIVTLHLTVLKPAYDSFTVSLCEGEGYAFGGQNRYAAGSYVDSITAANGCDSVRVLTLVVHPTPVANFSFANPAQCFAANSFAAVDSSYISSGSMSYYWQFGNGDTSTAANPAISYSSSGSYSVQLVLSSNHGCTDTTSRVATVYPNTPSIAIGFSNPLCYGDSNGSISLQTQGGVGGFAYSLNNGSYQSGSSFAYLKAGAYSLSVKDSNGCVADTQATLTQPGVLTATTTQSNVRCFGDSNGVCAVSVSGGVLPYHYQLGNGAIQDSGIFAGLKAGMHTVYVTDSHGCGLVVHITITHPARLSFSSFIGSVGSGVLMCFGDSAGEIEAAASGGTLPYQYKLGAGSYQSSQIFSGLKAGSYTATVMDTNGCTDTFTYQVMQQNPLSLGFSITAPLCHGDSNGQVQATVNGGTAPYRYSWNGGGLSSSNQLNAAKAGNFSLLVTDSLGCTATDSVTLTEPGPLGLGAQLTHLLCFGDSNGTIDASGSGGSGVYQYSLNGINFQSSGLFTNLKSGSYTVSVKDSNNCMAQQSVSIIQPASAVGLSSFAGYVSCSNTSGFISITASGGVGGYQYKLGNGNYQTSPTFSNLSAGTYSITTKDSNGCTATAQATVPVIASQLAISLSKTNPCCDGTATGSITATISGGTKPYAVLLVRDGDTLSLTTDTAYIALDAADYTLTAIDNNGCSVSASTTLTEPSQMVPTITWTGATDTMWSNAANWNPARLPKATDSVYLPGALSRYPTLTISSTVQAIKADSGAWIKSQNTGVLIINGTYSNRGNYKAWGGVLHMKGETGLPAGTYHALVINGQIKLCGDIAVNNTLVIQAGKTLDNRGYHASGVADINNYGTFSGNGRLILTRDYGFQTIQGGGSFSNLELNGATNMGARILHSCTISDSLLISKGTLILYPNTTLTVGSTASAAGYISCAGGYIQSGNAQPSHLQILGNQNAPHLPDLKFQIKGNVKINRPKDVVIAGNSFVWGGLNLESGNLNMNGFDLTLGSATTTESITTNTSSYLTNSKKSGKLTIAGGAASPLVSNLNIDTVYQVDFKRSKGVSLGRNMVAGNLVSLTAGYVNLNGKEMWLDSMASLSEAGNGVVIRGDSGSIATTRRFNSPITSINIAGLGLKVSTTSATGITYLQRAHTMLTTGSGKSIKRLYSFQPANSTTLSCEFMYDTTELAGATHNRLRLNTSTNATTWNTLPTTRSGLYANPLLFAKNISVTPAALLITASDSVQNPLMPNLISEFSADKSKACSVYPNPTTGEFSLIVPADWQATQIVVFDIHGRFVQQLNPLLRTFNTHNLAKGVYILELRSVTHPGITHLKLVKE